MQAPFKIGVKEKVRRIFKELHGFDPMSLTKVKGAIVMLDTGIPFYSIEQDKPFMDRDIFESMKISFDNLRAMGVK